MLFFFKSLFWLLTASDCMESQIQRSDSESSCDSRPRKIQRMTRDEELLRVTSRNDVYHMSTHRREKKHVIEYLFTCYSCGNIIPDNEPVYCYNDNQYHYHCRITRIASCNSLEDATILLKTK